MLPRQHRLTSRREIKAVFAGGKTYVNKLLVLKLLRAAEEQPGRIAFSTSAALGNAVMRNRARRLLREAVRLLIDKIEQHGYSAVLIARPPIKEAVLAEVSRAVEELLQKAGLLAPSQQLERAT